MQMQRARNDLIFNSIPVHRDWSSLSPVPDFSVPRPRRLTIARYSIALSIQSKDITTIYSSSSVNAVRDLTRS